MSRSPHELERLLGEQPAYYRARAPEYLENAFSPDDFGSETLQRAGDELVKVLDDFAPTSDVLELTCGPGTWTPQLLLHRSRPLSLAARSPL